jgi:hypothetical protein
MVKTIYDVRRENLEQLIDTKFYDEKLGKGNRSAFARAAGKNVNLINLSLTPNIALRKPIGEKLARDMEAAVQLPRGWLDQDRGNKTVMVGVPRIKGNHVSAADVFPEMMVVGDEWLHHLTPNRDAVRYIVLPNMVLLVDTSNTEIVDGDRYLVNDGGNLIPAVLHVLPDGKVGLHGLVLSRKQLDVRGRVIMRMSMEKV